MAPTLNTDVWQHILDFAAAIPHNGTSIDRTANYLVKSGLHGGSSSDGRHFAKTFSLVNKELRKLSEPVIYGTLEFSNPYATVSDGRGWTEQNKLERCRKRIEFLASHVDLAAHVTRLVVSDWNPEHIRNKDTALIKRVIRGRSSVSGFTPSSHFNSTFSALQHFICSLPRLLALCATRCSFSAEFYASVFSSLSIRALVFDCCWDGWKGPQLPDSYVFTPINLQELRITPSSPYIPMSRDSSLYHLLMACKDSLLSVGLTLDRHAAMASTLDSYFPFPWPQFPKLKHFFLYIQYFDHTVPNSVPCEWLLQFFLLHRSLEDVWILSYSEIEWLRPLFLDTTILPEVRTCFGSPWDVLSLVPGRPIQMVTIDFVYSGMTGIGIPADFSLAPLGLSTVPLTQIHLVLRAKSTHPVVAAKVCDFALELANLEVFIFNGLNAMPTQKDEEETRRHFMERLCRWKGLQKIYVKLECPQPTSIKPRDIEPTHHPVVADSTALTERGHPSLREVKILCAGEWIWFHLEGWRYIP